MVVYHEKPLAYIMVALPCNVCGLNRKYLECFGMDFTHNLPLVLFVEKCTTVWTGIGWQVDTGRVRLGHKVPLVAQ